MSEYSVDAAKIKSVDTERLDSGKILKITVEGYLGDSCTQLYEDEIKTFQKPGLVHVVIPTKRKKNQACTQVISDFVRVFEIDIDPDRGMPDIVVNMREFPR